MVTVRVNVRHFAALHKMYTDLHIPVPTKAAVVSTALEDYYGFLEQNGKITGFLTTESALAYTESVTPTMTSDRNRRALLASMRLDEEATDTTSLHDAIKRLEAEQ